MILVGDPCFLYTEVQGLYFTYLPGSVLGFSDTPAMAFTVQMAPVVSVGGLYANRYKGGHIPYTATMFYLTLVHL